MTDATNDADIPARTFRDDNTSERSVLTKVIPYLWPENQPQLRFRVVLSMILLVVAKVITLATPLFFSGAVDALAPEEAGQNTGFLLALGPVALVVGFGLARAGQVGFNQMRDAVFARVGQRALRRLALETFEHIHALSMRYHIARKTGGLSRIIERGVKGVDFLLRFVLFSIGPLIVELALMAAIFWYMFGVGYMIVVLTTITLYTLFTFKVTDPRLDGLLGLSANPAEVSIQQSKLRSRGSVLITHWGLSGPGILKISAWGARELAALDYRFDISVNWLPDADPAAVIAEKRINEGKRQLSSRSPFASIPKRLWLRLLAAAGVSDTLTWSRLSKQQANQLLSQLTAASFRVNGKSTNKDEFVTCGGVDLNGINFRTMESKLVPGLYFAGEVIDVDGVTGGFNFQNAWTNGFHAGSDIAAR